MLATILALSLLISEADMVVTTNTGMLDRNGVIQYVGQNASQYGLDPAAVLAVANHEGLNSAPGSTWNLSKAFGEPIGSYNFGPPSWYTGGAGGTIVGMQGSNAPAWSWTPAGIDYWLQQVSNAIGGGLRGESAVSAIVHKFERPREDLRAGEIRNAMADYNSFQQLVGQGGTGVPLPIPLPGQTPAQSNPSIQIPTDTGVQGTVGAGPMPTSGMNLNLSDSIRHLSFQFLLVLFALALLLGGIYLLGSRK